MTQLFYKFGWMLCALSACSVHISAILPQHDNVINGYMDTCPAHFTGLLPYRYDCRRFLNCWKGRGILQSCSPGTNFNAATLECDRPEKVVCMGNVNSASPRAQPLLLEPIKQIVPRQDHRCPDGANGPHPHPTDCHKFLNCDHGKTYIMNCGTGTLFNPALLVCDYPRNVNCGAVVRPNSIGSPEPPESPVKDEEEKEVAVRCPRNKSGLHAHSWNCAKFINYAFANLVDEHDCQPGTAFNAAHVWCDDSVSCVDHVAAPLDHYALAVASCPPSIDGPHLYQYDESKYIYCRNGQLVVQQCLPGATYNITKSQCSESYNNRDSKSFSDPNEVNARLADYGNRWSNMNRTRPTISTVLSHSQGSHDQQIPNQRVIYEEGTLDRNFIQTIPKYSTQFEPFATTTTKYDAFATTYSTTPTAQHTNVFYALPVESLEEVFAFNTPTYTRPQTPLPITHNTLQNSSREFHHPEFSASRWTLVAERPTAHNLFGETNLQATDPFDYLLTPDNSVPITRLMPPVPLSEAGQREYESKQPPLELDGMNPSETQPGFSNWKSAPTSPNLYDGYNPKSHSALPTSTTSLQFYDHPATPITADESNLFGGLQPPPPTQQTTTPLPNRLNSAPSTTPATNFRQWSNVRNHKSQERDSNTRVFQIYPPVNLNMPKLSQQDPLYSPSYSNVAHTWGDPSVAGRKIPIPPNYTSPDSWPDRGDLADPELDDAHVTDFGLTTTTEYRGATMLPYNRQYYWGNIKGGQQRTARDDDDDNNAADLSLSEAVLMLLRPYFNRSGTISGDTAAQSESHIMKLIAEPIHERVSATNTTATSTSTTSTTTTPQPLAEQKREVELILAGEQSSLTSLPMPRAANDDGHKFETSAHSEQRNHSREFRRRHPNIPKPSTFANDERSLSNPGTIHNHSHHPQHTQQPLAHSQEFHLRHPSIWNPFAITDQSDEELPNPFAEPTTSISPYDIDLRFYNNNVNSSKDTCEFHCDGLNKCIKLAQVCNGIKDCDDLRDENNCDHLGYAIRLAGGDSPNVGRIEVRVNGLWGYVCDDKFGLRDADVVCRELGFKQGANEVRGASYYPPDNTNIQYLMDQLDCNGNETSLRDCNFNGWGIHNCGPDEVACVVCKVPMLKCPNDYWLCGTSKECIPPAFVCDHTPDCADKSDESEEVCKAPIEYRVEGGRKPSEGRLEVKYHREWGTICDDDFGTKEAQVACDSMGFFGKASVRKNIYGQGNGPIWLDQVSCFGNESSLDKCHHFNWGEHNCNHTEDVSIECSFGPPPSTRLNGVTQKSTVRAELLAPEALQTAHEDIGLYPRRERQLRFQSSIRLCGQYKTELTDAHSHPEERVINGTVAKRGRHPWQATIRTRGRGGISSHWCGAVLISKMHLLTAAHCLAGYPKGAYFVRMGDHYANIAESTEIDAFIENWYIHEKFRDQMHMNNDIAVIVLKQPVRFNDYIQPVCLPDKDTPLAENRMCTISGWGSIKSGVSTPSNILRSAQLPLIADSVCKQPHVYGPSMSEGMFCAGSMDESMDACDGDSGGPLVCSDDGGDTLYGIISWGQHCGYVNKPGVYVRVEKYIEWIYEKINYSLQRT